MDRIVIKTPLPIEIDDKDKVIFDLWMLLEGVETVGDSLTNKTIEKYRDKIEHLLSKRHFILNEVQVDNLYEKYNSEKKNQDIA